jgi:uncharacterized phage-associated protein
MNSLKILLKKQKDNENVHNSPLFNGKIEVWKSGCFV